MRATHFETPHSTAATEHQRLRAMALRLIGEANRFFVMDFLEDTVAAFAGRPDPAAWRPYVDVTDAVDAQWFHWRDPSDRTGQVHVDQVTAANGHIAAKFGGGLMDFTECQPCRLAPDVRDALARLATLGYPEWG